METKPEESVRIIRILIVAYLISWLAGIVLSIVATEYIVSDRIDDYSWRTFTIASIVEIALVWISAIGVFFAQRWARGLFLMNVCYALLYLYVFGGGAGNPAIAVIGSIHTMLVGAVLYAIFLEPKIGIEPNKP